MTSPVGTITTAPAQGSPAAFRFILASCHNATSVVGHQVPALALAADPLFILAIGDQPYDDNKDGDRPAYLAKLAADATAVKRNPQYFTRAWRKLPYMVTLLGAVPVFTIPGDHDFVSNDLDWESDVSGETFDDIGAQVRTVWRETTPHPALFDPSGGCLGFAFRIANCAFIVMDTESQKNPTEGSMLGHNHGYEHFDQFTAVCDAITDAGADGCTLLFLTTPTTWANAHAGWRSTPFNYVAEHDLLNDHIAATVALYPQLRVVILTGDMHESAADDETFTDYSTSGIARMIQIVGSPWHSASAHTLAFTWNGVSSYHDDSDEMLCVIDVDATNTQVAFKFYDCVTGSAVEVGSYNTADLAAWA
jgi:hypothetical protein